MTQDTINWQQELKPFWAKSVDITPHPYPEIIEAIDAANRIDDARILASIALRQVNGAYDRDSNTAKLIVMLEAIQGILEGNMDELNNALENARKLTSMPYNP